MFFVQSKKFNQQQGCQIYTLHPSGTKNKIMPLGVSTLGPCAEAMGLSAMMVFCIGVAQLPVMIGLAMHVPSVRVDLYSPYLDVGMDPSTNHSAVVIPSPIHKPSPEQQEGGAIMQVNAAYMHGINISGLFVLCASSFTFFVVLTMQFVDRGLRSSGPNGSSSSDEAVGMLVASFQASFFIARCPRDKIQLVETSLKFDLLLY